MGESEQNVYNSADSPEGESAPRVGTLAWVAAHDLVARGADMLPSCHRVPVDATLATPEDEPKRCRVTLADGKRCRGPRLAAFGLCMGHAGGGGTRDLDAMRQASAEKRAKLKLTRQLLGIGGSRAADPRYAVRLRAAQRAQDIALAVVDGPLDAEITAVEKQRAALAALDASFPLVTASLTVEIPDDPEQMSWQDMQSMALSLDS